MTRVSTDYIAPQRQSLNNSIARNKQETISIPLKKRFFKFMQAHFIFTSQLKIKNQIKGIKLFLIENKYPFFNSIYWYQ